MRLICGKQLLIYGMVVKRSECFCVEVLELACLICDNSLYAISIAIYKYTHYNIHMYIYLFKKYTMDIWLYIYTRTCICLCIDGEIWNYELSVAALFLVLEWFVYSVYTIVCALFLIWIFSCTLSFRYQGDWCLESYILVGLYGIW